MDEHFRQLTEYINQQLENGVAEEHIREILIQHNWNAAMVDKAFLAIKSRSVAHATTNVNATQDLNQYHENHHTDTSAHADNQIDLNSAAPKYKVFQAIADTVKAIRKNLKAYIAVTVLSYVIAFAIIMILTFILDQALYGIQLFLVSLILVTVWSVLINSLVLTTTSIALLDGSENRKSSILAVFKKGISRLGRVVATHILLFLIIFLPAILAIFLPAMISMSRADENNIPILMYAVSSIVAIIWVCITLIRFALAPYVALFEPNIPIAKTLSRSNHLLTKGGQWFLIKGFLLYIFVVIILSLVTRQNIQDVAITSDNTISSVLTAIAAILAYGALVMLYLNRKKIRD